MEDKGTLDCSAWTSNPLVLKCIIESILEDFDFEITEISGYRTTIVERDNFF